MPVPKTKESDMDKKLASEANLLSQSILFLRGQTIHTVKIYGCWLIFFSLNKHSWTKRVFIYW